MSNRFDQIIDSIKENSGIDFSYSEISDSETKLTIELRDSSLTKGMGYLILVKLLNARVLVEIGYESVARKILEFSLKGLKENQNLIEDIVNNHDFIREMSFHSSGSKMECSELLKRNISDITNLKIKLYTGLMDLANQENVLFRVLELVIPLLLLIFPYEEEVLGEIEGQRQELLQTKYERSRKNRTLCLTFYGYSCQACGINMEQQYGKLGKNFIHIHHKTPVSISGVCVIDPIIDLIPLCPNCHSMVHRVSPPLDIEKLKEIIEHGSYEK